MKEKTMCLVAVFHTTAEAMATEKICKAENLDGKLISAPRTLTADCGIAWRAPLAAAEATKAALAREKVEVQGFYEILL